MDDMPSKEQMVECLRKSGYLLEGRLVRCLNELGLFVDPSQFCRMGNFVAHADLFNGKAKCSGMISAYKAVFLGIYLVLVILAVLAELFHAYRLRTFGTLLNRYTFGFALSVIVALLRVTDNMMGSDPPVWMVIFYMVFVDIAAMYLFGVYAFIRGGHLVFTLFGKGHSYEARCPMQGRLDMCRFIAWTFIVLFIIRGAPFIVVWFIDLVAF